MGIRAQLFPAPMRLVALVALGVFALDQITKLAVVFGMNLIERGVIEVVPPYLTFRMAWNDGVNFGLFSSGTGILRWLLIGVAVAIAAWVWRWMARDAASRRARIAGGLLIGGALGNVVDRVAYGAVADFLNMSCCGIENPYAFNVADIAIFAGALGLVLFTGAPKGPARRRASPRRKTP